MYVLGWVAQGALAVGQQQPQPLGLNVYLVDEPLVRSWLQDHRQTLWRPLGSEHGPMLAVLGSSGEHAGILSMWGKLSLLGQGH